MHKYKVPNLHKIILDFSLSNARSILVNSSFKSISFANNRDHQENSTFEIIYKSNHQIPETRTNIKYKLVKKKRITLEEKQAKIAQKEAAKL